LHNSTVFDLLVGMVTLGPPWTPGILADIDDASTGDSAIDGMCSADVM